MVYLTILNLNVCIRKTEYKKIIYESVVHTRPLRFVAWNTRCLPFREIPFRVSNIGRITSLVALSGVVSVRLSHDTTGDLRPCFLMAEPIGPF